MAKFRFPLGKISGKCGDKVFRDTAYGNIISSAPKKSEKPATALALNKRAKFKFVNQLAAAVTKLTLLRLMWKKAAKRNDNRCKNKVYQKNYYFIDEPEITGITLSPDYNFYVYNPDIKIKQGKIKISASELGINQDINPSVEKRISAQGILCLSSPANNLVPDYTFIPVSSKDQKLSLKAALKFIITLSDTDVSIAKNYKSIQAAFTILTLDKDGMPVQASSTIFFKS